MIRPWMPLYVADYQADTAHLSTTEHGAYLLLIMFYWTKGALPENEDSIRRVTRMTSHQWSKSRDVLSSLFLAGWRHKRIDEELAKAIEKSQVNSANAKLRHSDRTPIAQRSETHARASSQSQSQSEEKEEEPEACASAAEAAPDPSEPERQFFQRGRELLGKSAGGQLAKLLKAAGGNVALARSKLELSATKDRPAEFLAKVITVASTGPPARPLTQHQINQQESKEAINALDRLIDRNGGGGIEADFGLLRLDSGNGQAGVHSGAGGAVIDLSPIGGSKGG